ncbi:MAG: hypothetical protein IKC09_07355 [Oscillospiraceae bacterium]|nr:hypothetical protein [Oscillospiraceae bacterium]
MTETQTRIKALKASLPGLKERVLAVALLLVMSAAMMTSATYAWLTISLRPELTGVNTTVAANGSLEIALATGDGTEAPGESKVGDSSAAEGQTITGANITWGNLVNLGDPMYGLDNLTLRPAQLNTAALLTSPLYGAVYTADGRVEKLTSNFGYTAWVPAQGNTPGYFGLSEQMGVRAISSTRVFAGGYYGDWLTMKNNADIANVNARNAFTAITRNEEWMLALGNVIGIHMTATLNTEDRYVNAAVDPDDLKSLIAMYEAFIDAFEMEADAIAQTLNTQAYLALGGNMEGFGYTAQSILDMAKDVNKMSGNDYTFTLNNGKVLTAKNLKPFLKDYNIINDSVGKFRLIDQSGDRRWSYGAKSGETRTITKDDGTTEVIQGYSLKTLVAQLVNIDNCYVDGKTVKALMTEFTSGISGAMTALGYKDKEVSVVITNGVLYNFEQRVGSEIEVRPYNANGKKKYGLPVTAIMYVNTANLGEQVATIYATISTSATKPADFTTDLTYASYDNKELNSGQDTSGDNVTMESEDTYGLAVDLWVRTNAEASFLGLEGNVLTKPREVDATTKDANGNTVILYTLTRTEQVSENVYATDPTTGENVGDPIGTTPPESVTNTYELYKIETTADGETTTTWYNAQTYAVFELKDGETPTKKILTVYDVIGYEGENRVWDKGDLISADATTQGSGSCYVYYADTPEDQARSLELLKAFNVAFVDEKGELLAIAQMDTLQFYAEAGRVTVPLKLTSGVKVSENEDGSPNYAITALEKNVPKRITAIVFLDGTLLSNEDVLSAADIQGQLNIQFGSSVDLNAIDNETLETAERKVSATLDKTSFNFDTDTNLTTTVTVRVDGEQPKTVEAFFTRRINATQGTREPESITFKDNGDGTWTGTYKFTAPGTYILRSVRLDGVDYDLPTQEGQPNNGLPTVEVKGFTVASLTCDKADANRHISIMTANNSEKVKVTLRFATDDETKMPKTVSGRFLREDGTAVNVSFTYNSNQGTWVGDANFLSSGEYDFQYLVLDGRYTELEENMWQSATVYLGMRVAVYTTSPTSFKYLPDEMTDNQKILGLQVKIMDNSGAELPGLTGAKLVYKAQGSFGSMDTDLIWNPSGHYVGELRALESGGPGTWSFANVTVNGNTLTNATTAPTFKLISPEPPSYVGYYDQYSGYAFVPNGGACVAVDLKYSATSTVEAVILDSNGREYTVQGTMGTYTGTAEDNTTRWLFTIPDGTGGTQDGYWTVKEVHIWNYYENDGTYVKAEIDASGKLIPDGERDEPMTIDMTDKNYTVKVVETVYVSFTKDYSQDLGMTDGKVTGIFMASHEVKNVSFTIADFENQPIRNVSDVKIDYEYGGGSQEKGGYSGGNVPTNGTVAFTLTFDAEEGVTIYTQQSVQSAQFAGMYNPVLSFKVNGSLYNAASSCVTISGVVPKFTVNSLKPTVTIDSISPSDSHKSMARSGNNSKTVDVTSAVVGNTITIYAEKTNPDNGTIDTTPSVTLRINNLGEASATLKFTASGGGTVYMYTGINMSSRTDTYSWTKDTPTYSLYVGQYKSSGSCRSMTYEGAGTLVSNSFITVTYDNADYTFTVDPITIINNNPPY